MEEHLRAAGRDALAADRASAVAAQLDFFFGSQPMVSPTCCQQPGMITGPCWARDLNDLAGWDTVILLACTGLAAARCKI